MSGKIHHGDYMFFTPSHPWPPYTLAEQQLYEKICQQQSERDSRQDQQEIADRPRNKEN